MCSTVLERAAGALFEFARRTFDTPEFRGIEFIESEVKRSSTRFQAKALPFDWTINPVQGLFPRLHLLLRPPDPHLPRHGSRPRLRDQDRRQGQCPGAATQGARGQALEGRAHRDGHEHRPVPAGRGALPAHAGDHRGVDRLPQPVLGTHEGTPTSAGPRSVTLHAAEVAPVSAAFSIGTLDERVWRETELGTPAPSRRIDAVRALTDAGIPTGVLIAPVLPGISRRAGTTPRGRGGGSRRGCRPTFRPSCCTCDRASERNSCRGCRSHHPELVQRYRSMYVHPYGPKDDRDRIGSMVRSMVGGRTKRRASSPGASRFDRGKAAPREPATQLPLF